MSFELLSIGSTITDWIMTGFRSICAGIDRTIYSLIASLYQLILGLADFQIFTQEGINDFYSRVYTLLGVFMLFKVTFSFINYVINPDLTKDNTKGTGNLVKNILIVIVLIVITPFGFAKIREAQDAILDDQVLPKFILGQGDGTSVVTEYKISNDCALSNAASQGDYIALLVFRPFYQPNEEAASAVLDGTDYCFAYSSGTVKTYLNPQIYKASDDDGNFAVDYNFLISTVIGVVIVLIFISFCFDIAVRSIKLGFLELIAPIPIISYVDPNSSKNGIFSKWINMIFSTWASLFIRLAAVYLAVYIIAILDGVDFSHFGSNEFWARLIVIIAVLIFAKQFPKMIEELFPGLKMAGTFQLNPFKKVANEAAGGKLITGAAIGAGAMAVTGIASGTANTAAYLKNRSALKSDVADKLAKYNDNPTIANNEAFQKANARLRAEGSMRRLAATSLGGTAAGMRKGLSSGYKNGSAGKYNPFMGMKTSVSDTNKARNNRNAIRGYNAEAGVTGGEKYGFFERNVNERVDELIGFKNEYAGVGYYDKQVAKLTKDIENNDSKESALRTAFANYCAQNGVDQLGYEQLHKNIADGMDETTAYATAASSMGMSAADIQTKYESNIKTQLSNIDSIDAATKDLKTQRKSYSEMQKTREEVKKK